MNCKHDVWVGDGHDGWVSCMNCKAAVNVRDMLKSALIHKEKPTHTISAPAYLGMPCDPPKEKPWNKHAIGSPLEQRVLALEKQLAFWKQWTTKGEGLVADRLRELREREERLHRRVQKAEGQVEQLWKTIAHLGTAIDELTKKRRKKDAKKDN